MRTVVAQGVPFEVIPTVLVGIQFRCVRRQELDVQARVASEEFVDFFAAMRVQSIPDHEDVATQMTH